MTCPQSWWVSREKLNIWVDASSLAISVLLEEDGTAWKDVCWLHTMNDKEFSAMLKRVNLVLQLKSKMFHMQTFTMYVSLDIRHSNREGKESDQGSKQEAD